MTYICDTDGTPLRRDRDGSLVPDPTPEPLPTYTATDRCKESGHFASPAARCTACWSEIKGGDRPRQYLGRVYQS